MKQLDELPHSQEEIAISKLSRISTHLNLEPSGNYIPLDVPCVRSFVVLSTVHLLNGMNCKLS